MGSNKRPRKKKGRFVGIPYHVANSEIFGSLKPAEIKLLIDLLCQCNGNNNGCLSPCHSLMSKRGWAKSSLYRAFSGLVEKGFLVVTRKGWKQRGRPTLVAITWNEIDDPPSHIEYDDGIKPHPTPLGYWCKDPASWRGKLSN